MILTPEPLNAESFAPFGDVIDTNTAANSFEINYGLTTRYHDMANIDVEEKGGKVGLSIFSATAVTLPHTVKVMEYHPYGSQLFYPAGDIPFFILVAPPSEILQEKKLALFISNGTQGVNFNKGTWHHFLLPINESGNKSDFIVVDRIGTDKNCVEQDVQSEVIIPL